MTKRKRVTAGPMTDGPSLPWPGSVPHDWGITSDSDTEPDMPDTKVKDRVLDAVRSLPDDATVEDAMERLYFLAKIDEGIRQAAAGESVSHEEAKRRVIE